MRYEIWFRDDWNRMSTNYQDVMATIDMAMIKATELSRSGRVTFVLDKNQNPSVVRGFGMQGSWVNAINCKKCNNSSYDEEDCKACMSASWKHIK